MKIGKNAIKDNGGTRSGTDRRKLSMHKYGPDKRFGIDRRSESDRRKKQKFRGELAVERRSVRPEF
jgi:hypothetical protein